jgi:hypothetical protein
VVRFIIVSVMMLGAALLIVIDTRSVYLGVLLLLMMIVQYDQTRRIRAMSVILKRLWTDAKYGQKGVSL